MDYLKGEKHMGMISIDENFLDFLLMKNLNDISPAELEFEQKIKGTVNQQIDETIQLLQSEEYRHSLFRSSEEKQKFLDSIKEKTEELLQAGYTDVNVIVNELYEEGRKQGLIDIDKSTDIIWGTGDQYALQHLLTYDMGLIQKLTDDTRKDIANEIFKGVLNGESIPKIAKRIKDIPNFKPLEGTKLTANQRAMLIARTETMRAKNTGLLNSYKQYNVEYVDVMPAIDACDACKDFAKIHNPIPLNDVKGFLPLHPRCRCTYAPASLDELLTLPKKDFKSVEPVPKELYETVNFDYLWEDDSSENDIIEDSKINYFNELNKLIKRGEVTISDVKLNLPKTNYEDYVDVEDFTKFTFKDGISIYKSKNMDESKVLDVKNFYDKLPTSLKLTDKIILSNQSPIKEIRGDDGYIGGFVSNKNTNVYLFKGDEYNFNEYLVHELSHVLDHNCELSNSNEYVSVYKKDYNYLNKFTHLPEKKKFISGYAYTFYQEAKKPDSIFNHRIYSEDFAESIKEYVINRKLFENKFPNRFDYFEKLLNKRG